MRMRYPELLASIAQLPGVATDTRDVRPGGVFVGGFGPPAQHAAYAREALDRGAALVVGGTTLRAVAGEAWVEVEDCRLAAAELAARFHDFPSRHLRVIGVTGTCGKTTTTWLLEAMLSAAGERVGVIGTVSYRYPGHERPAGNTTPGAVELQALLAEMRGAGCTAVVMEVSSHALEQRRVHDVWFDAAVFTNFSSEHLDFHGTLDAYFASKSLLFTREAAASVAAGKHFRAVLNGDDPWVAALAGHLAGPVQRFGAAVGDRWSLSPAGVTVHRAGHTFRAGLVGRFNAENVLAAAACALALGVAPAHVQAGLDGLGQVPGRLERIPDPRGAHLFVDYAHKPGALEVVLTTLRELTGGARLRVLFGCGGDRDQVKRPVMGEIAARLADDVWLTSDNPRTEDPAEILESIRKGTGDAAHVHVLEDRRAAIRAAVAATQPGDVLLIAGRGPEPDQVVGVPGQPGKTRKIPFDDRVEVAEAVRLAVGGG